MSTEPASPWSRVIVAIIWLGVIAVMGGVSLGVGLTIWNMPATDESVRPGASIAIMCGKLILAIGLFGLGLSKSAPPAVRGGALIAAAVLVASGSAAA